MRSLSNDHSPLPPFFLTFMLLSHGNQHPLE
jgi:hypothetical protein